MKGIIQRVRDFNRPLLDDKVRLKYRFMCENLYRFYRGTCHIFYEDLQNANKLPASPAVWVCGDLHLENFGSYKSDNRLVYFDLNDFDEATLAPATWELVRLVTSIFIAFQTLKISQKKAINMAKLFLRSYAATLVSGKPNYIEPNTASGIVCAFLSSASKRKTKKILQKRTVKKKKKLQLLKEHPRHLPLEEPFKKELMGYVDHWLQNDGNSPYNYKVIDAVFRLAGTGSVGLKRYALLLQSVNDNGEPYFLIDMKQARSSSLRPYVPVNNPEWPMEAERIRFVQQLMQNRPPALLSTTMFKGEPYIIQEMQSTKDNIEFRLLKDQYRDMCQVIHDMGMLTASSQLRSAGRLGSAIADDLVVFGRNNEWQEAIITYAIDYSAQVKTYYTTFKMAYKNGSL